MPSTIDEAASNPLNSFHLFQLCCQPISTNDEKFVCFADSPLSVAAMGMQGGEIGITGLVMGFYPQDKDAHHQVLEILTQFIFESTFI